MSHNGPVVILGAGGHARSVASLLALGGYAVVGVLDRRHGEPDERIGGHAVIGTFDALAEWAARGAAVALALGDNRERAQWWERARQVNARVLGLRHPSAIVDPDADIAPDATLCAGVIVGPAARVSANALLNTGCIVDHESVISAHAHVAVGARIAGRVHVGTGVLVGAGAVIRDACAVGDGAVVGAGAVVVRDVDARTVVVGVPATPRGDLRSPWDTVA